MMLPHEWHGNERGDVVVFGNSLGTTSWSWHHQVDALSDRFRILTFELPGHYDAEVQGAFSFDDIVEQTAQLLEGLGLSGVAFCGVSLGGALGVALAAAHPELVSRLVVVNAPIRQPSREFWLERADAVEGDGLAQIAETITRRWLRDSTQASYDAAELTRIFGNLPVQGYANACRALADLDILSACAGVTASTLVVSAAKDVAVDPDNSTEIVAHIQGAQLYPVLDAAHLVTIDQPELFTTILENFLS